MRKAFPKKNTDHSVCSLIFYLCCSHGFPGFFVHLPVHKKRETGIQTLTDKKKSKIKEKNDLL